MRVVQHILLIGSCTLMLHVVTTLQKEVLSPNIDICRLFKNEVKLRKPGTCAFGIECKNFKSEDFIDCESTSQKWFSLKTLKCEGASTDTYCKHACTKNSPQFVVDKKNCNGWYACAGDKELGSGICAHGQYFDQKRQTCMYPDAQTTCQAEYDFCDVVPPGVAFRDEANCHKYFECNSKNKLEVKTCDIGKYFDVAEGKCIAKAQVHCYQHPLPEDVCGTKKLAKRNRFVSDQATCRGYFYCKDLGVGVPDPDPHWGQCEPNDFFDAKEEACKPREHVRCEEDRCDARVDGKALSEKKGCQHYLVCQDNHTVSEELCPSGLYFDAAAQECVSAVRLYPVCA